MLLAMATADFFNGIESVRPSAEANADHCPLRSDLPLLRFGTRQLLWFFVGTSVFFAALASADGATALVLTVMTTIVVAHVSATAIGTRLKSRSNAQNRFEAAETLPTAAIATAVERYEHVTAIHAQPRSPWHSRGATSLPWLRQFVVMAIVLGGLAGAAVLALVIGYRTSPAGIVVGGLSAAVLCGWFAFLCGSFYGVFRHGFRDATASASTSPHSE